MPLSSLARSGLVEEVVDAILTMISEDGLQPGDILPSQADLMTQLEVGRTSLREAIQRLAALGAVEVRLGKRMVMGSGIPYGRHTTAAELERHLRRAALHEISEMRDLLEPEVAALAAQRATQDEIRQLETLLERARTLNDPAAAVEINVAFHCMIAEATHNQALHHILKVATGLLLPLHKEMYERLWERFPAYRLDTEHQLIVESLKRRDPVSARRAMSDHIRIFRRYLTDTYGTLPAD